MDTTAGQLRGLPRALRSLQLPLGTVRLVCWPCDLTVAAALSCDITLLDLDARDLTLKRVNLHEHVLCYGLQLAECTAHSVQLPRRWNGSSDMSTHPAIHFSDAW